MKRKEITKSFVMTTNWKFFGLHAQQTSAQRWFPGGQLCTTLAQQ